MKYIWAFVLIFLIDSCTPHTSNNTDQNLPTTIVEKNQPKNIIFMVGDGMGLGQITAAVYSSKKKLNLERFPVVGLHKTHPVEGYITDSAAAATSFACGIKTYNGAIGVNKDTIPVKTILEEAEENGLATGMVATSTIVHATPASFVSHVKKRNLYENIAKDFLDVEIDFFIGGGKKYFDRRESDDRNLITELKKKNYIVNDYFDSVLEELTINKKKNFAYFTADGDPLPVSQGRKYLKKASKMGMNFLSKHSDKGFFFMIEGSQIDWGGHANKSDYIISEALDFDKTIGAVLDFAKKDGETLVIVTADHETGGYSIVRGSTSDTLATKFTTTYHTATMVPVFAYGPGAEKFAGIYENTEIYFKMREAFGFGKKEK